MEILYTPRLVLSAPTTDDAPAITSACQDPQIGRWTTLPVPYEPHHAESFIRIVAEGWATGHSPTWALRRSSARGTGGGPDDAGSGTLIGMVSLMDEGTASAELGFWMAPEGRGQGLMTEAVHGVCRYGLERMGLQRISWRAQVGNIGSARIAQRAGFRYEGLLRQGLAARGVRNDGWLAALLPGDVEYDDGAPTTASITAATATWPVELRI